MLDPRRPRSFASPAFLLVLGLSGAARAQAFGPRNETNFSPLGFTKVEVADWDADGIPDLLILNTSSQFLVRKGSGAGSFSSAPSITLPYNVNWLHVADLDASGAPDLVLGDYSVAGLYVISNDGSGGVASIHTVSLTYGARFFASGEFDGSPGLDLVASGEPNAGLLQVATNDGANQFTAVGSPFAMGNNACGVAVGDLDGDALPDVVVGVTGGFWTPATTHIAVRLGTGGGSFGPLAAYQAGNDPIVPVLGNFNGDGRPDVAITSSQGAAVLLNDGAGGFGSPVYYVPSGPPHANSIVVADMNGDSKDDLVIGAYNRDRIFLGDGAGGFTGATDLPGYCCGFAYKATVGDLDLDGKLDIVDWWGGIVSVHLQQTGGAPVIQGTPVLSGSQIATGGSGRRAALLHDFDGDGKLELVTANGGSNDVSIHKGLGHAGFGAATTEAVGGTPVALAARDVSGDGKQDLIVARQASSNVGVLLGDGTLDLAAAVAYGSYGMLGDLALADVNGDGKHDAVTIAINDKIAVLPGNGDGTFQSALLTNSVSSPNAIAVGAFDAGSALDFVEVGGAHSFVVRFGDGAGGVTSTTYFPLIGTGNYSVRDVAILDMNADGKNDLVCVAEYELEVHLGDGVGGVLSSSQRLLNASYARSMAIADLDLDGRPDVVTNDEQYAKARVCMNTGTGTLASPVTLDTAGLDCKLALADLDADGDTDMVACPASGPTSSIFFNRGNGTFGASSFDVSGSTANSSRAAVGDLNQDSLPDVVTSAAVDFFSIQLNDSLGGVGPASTFMAMSGVKSTDLLLLDFDLDGTPDLAICDEVGGIAVHRGDGAGTFLNPPSFVNHTVAAFRLDAGDLDADGVLDLVALDTSSLVHLCLGTGGGAFSAPTATGLGGATAGGKGLAVADMDKDGFADVVVASSGPGTVTVLQNQQNGTLLAAGSLAAGLTLEDLVVYDVDKNGWPDVVVSDSGLARLTQLLLGPGLVELQRTYVALAGAPTSLLLADVNGDLVPDAVASIPAINRVAVLLGRVPGEIESLSYVTTPAATSQLAIGFFDPDARPDLVVGSGTAATVSLLTGNGTNLFASDQGSSSCAPGNPKAVGTGDMNKDGRKDTVSAYSGTPGKVAVQVSNGTPNPSCGAVVNAGNEPSGLAVFDLDHDGTLDVAVSNAGSNDVSVFLGDGAGGLTVVSAGPFLAGGSPSAIAAADTNGDSKADIILTLAPPANVIVVLLGNGDGTFGSPTVTGSPVSQPTDLDLADVTLDGTLDAITTESGSNRVSVHGGQPAGGFGSSTAFGVGAGPQACSVVDLNSDGGLDVVTANSGSNNVSLLINTGAGFGSTSYFPAGQAPQAIVGAPLNGDANADVVVTNPTTNSVSVLIGDGIGGLGAPISIAAGIAPGAIAAADFDGDGKIDLAVGSNSTSAVTTLGNSTQGPSGLSNYGFGTFGCNGSHGITGSGPSKIGNFSFAFLCTNAPPSSLGLGLATDMPNAAGYDPFFIGVTILLDVFGASEFYAFDFYSDPSGNGWTPVPIPNSPALVGKHYYAQGLWAWGAACSPPPSPFTLSSSNGLEIEILP